MNGIRLSLLSFCFVFVDSEEILSYEEVAMYYPQPNRKRPIVMIGPPNIGRDELRNKLMESDCERFAQAVPRKIFNILCYILLRTC